MKRIFFVIYISFLSDITFGQTAKDSLLIKASSLNYIEGFYTNDFKRVEKAIHSELAKRIVVKDSLAYSMKKNMGASELLYNTKEFKKPFNQYSEPFQATVIIFDISKDIAPIVPCLNEVRLRICILTNLQICVIQQT